MNQRGCKDCRGAAVEIASPVPSSFDVQKYSIEGIRTSEPGFRSRVGRVQGHLFRACS